MKMFSTKTLVIWCLALFFSGVKGQVPGPPCTGQVLGEANPVFSTATAGANTATSYILLGSSMKIPCCGVVSEWMFGSLAAGDLTAQIWKQTGGNVYQVAGETVVTGVPSSTTMRQNIGATSQISVEKSFAFGWHSSAMDIVPYITDASSAMGHVSSPGKTAVGGSKTWSNALTDGQRWQIGVKLSPNSVPRFTSLPLTVNAKVSDAVGTVLHKVSVTDDNPNDVAGLTVSIAPAMPEFELVGNDIKIKSTLSVQTYHVVLEVVDHCLQTGTATLTVSVTDAAPVINSLPVAAPQTLREDTLVETLLHTLTYSDVDTPLTDVKCSISSTSPTPAPFVLKYKSTTSNYGVYFVPSASNPLDYDAVPTYNIYVKCNDGTSDSQIKLFQVDLVKNEDPVPNIPASIDVSAKTTTNGTIVYKVTATDVSPNPDKLTFTMSNCSCPFKMTTNGEIYATKDLNSHRTTPYVVNITVDDGYNTVGPRQMTIRITDINTPPNITNPTQKLPKIDTVYVKEHTDEGTPNLVGTTVSVFTAAGFDANGDTLTWEADFQNGLGEDLFNFDPATGKITTKKDLDYETLSKNGLLTTTVDIRAWDGREYSEKRTLQIVVEDVNETPVFNQKKYAIETTEGSATATTLECPLFDVTDEDNYDTRTYDINCGSVGIFHIPNTRTPTCDAFIEQTAEFDLDNPGKASQIVSCVITAYDKGGLTATTTLEITVKEIDDNPPVLDKTSYTYTITNDTTAGATFGSFSSKDKDFLPEHKRVTYTTDSSEFGVDANGVFFSKKDWTNVNAPTTRTFNLIATDEAGHTDTSPVTINIIDIPPTTTTTAAPTTLPAVYDNVNSFLDDPGNLAWIIPTALLGAAMLGLMGYMCYRCCASPGACANIFRGGNWFGRGGARGARGPGWFGRRTVVRQAVPRKVVSQPRIVRVIEERQPMRLIESRAIEEPVRKTPVKQAPPKKESSIFDCFKKKPSPKPKEEPKTWHLWNHTDFQSPQKWVG